ncbi:hypothetical protein D0962_25705 [Leptolyngbyaceae cyanobacterium CCMR0082]|uniref:Uncharacterized protein n=1 Tax=Adonisia turfae CCMR0082 TaxID=2304604 RepID=A0A6M0SCB7_9CYAN|nr:hypothetical protein [Adonisia turfae CCMR0082]
MAVLVFSQLGILGFPKFCERLGSKPPKSEVEGFFEKVKHLIFYHVYQFCKGRTLIINILG